MIVLLAAGVGTALATGVGALPVFLLHDRAQQLRPALLGFAAGVMAVASIAGLLLPGLDEGSTLDVALGAAIGVGFLLAVRRTLERRAAHAGRLSSGSFRTSLLVFVVLFAHSLPEGFAIGTAYASDTEGLSLFVILAIAIQNIPEGTSIAVPMQAAGYRPSRQFWAAVGTSSPQPVGALVAYLLVERIEGLLPLSFGFAAGAMLALVLVELLPQSLAGNRLLALTGLGAGAASMLLLSAALGV